MIGRWQILGLAFLVGVTANPAFSKDKAPMRDMPRNGEFYKDLPGVKPMESLVQKGDGLDCETVTVYRRWSERDIFRDFPVSAYRCEKNGVTYTGTQMPNRPWVPGLNPQTLPE
ncbi:hypothetical protein [Rhizobium helianthi]